MAEDKSISEGKALPFLPFEVQLQNVLISEIVARRFPVDPSTFDPSNLQIGINLDGINVEEKIFQAQVILNLQIIPSDEVHLFEIGFRLVGIFTYSQKYAPEMVRVFLEQGSLSILLPFARELLISLCTRLQLPPILLPMLQVAPLPTVNDVQKEETLP